LHVDVDRTGPIHPPLRLFALHAVNLLDELLSYALTLPEAWEDHPWGDTVVKVRKKIFLFVGQDEDAALRLSVKLGESHGHAMSLPGAAPTGYGLGKAGWVSLTVGEDGPGIDLLGDWVAESYRLVAPKRLAALLDAGEDGPHADA
jgi:predicted DNA-binding protein (MmcQ/YjbR family)